VVRAEIAAITPSSAVNPASPLGSRSTAYATVMNGLADEADFGFASTC
jgi:hypothetical protein